MTGDFKKPEKTFMFSSESLAEFFAGNFIGDVKILDELEDAYLIETKTGTRPLSKQEIETWLMGDRSVDKHTGSGDKNKDNNFIGEREKNLASMRKDDKILEGWFAQQGDVRLEFAMNEAASKGTAKSKDIDYDKPGVYKGAAYYESQAQEEA